MIAVKVIPIICMHRSMINRNLQSNPIYASRGTPFPRIIITVFTLILFCRAFLLAISMTIFVIVFIIPLILSEPTSGFYFAGGLLGITSSVCLSSPPQPASDPFSPRRASSSLLICKVNGKLRHPILCYSFVHFVIWELAFGLC
jgi:hypothetical protein